MADDPNPALRAELVAALAVLAPQIRGLHDLALVSISPELAAEIAKQITSRERRRDLINTVIAGLDSTWQSLNALQGDGYPSLPTVPLHAALLSELQGEETDLDAAVGLFTPEPEITLDIANVHFTSQPAPEPPGP
jgi:hypothetical protein